MRYTRPSYRVMVSHMCRGQLGNICHYTHLKTYQIRNHGKATMNFNTRYLSIFLLRILSFFTSFQLFLFPFLLSITTGKLSQSSLCSPSGFNPAAVSNLLTVFSNSSSPSFLNLVTFATFLAVTSRIPVSVARSRTRVFAVMAKRMSRGPSTSSRIADGAWSLLRFRGSIRRTRV